MLVLSIQERCISGTSCFAHDTSLASSNSSSAHSPASFSICCGMNCCLSRSTPTDTFCRFSKFNQSTAALCPRLPAHLGGQTYHPIPSMLHGFCHEQRNLRGQANFVSLFSQSRCLAIDSFLLLQSDCCISLPLPPIVSHCLPYRLNQPFRDSSSSSEALGPLAEILAGDHLIVCGLPHR